MARKSGTPNGWTQKILAFGTLLFSVVAITVLAVVAIRTRQGETMNIFTAVLPVFASWVGTILAFYFGRETFESASRQVQEAYEKLTPAQRAKALVGSIMRGLSVTIHFQIPTGKSDQDILLSEISSKLTDEKSRIPIIDAEGRPKYMVHGSRIDKYIASGGKEDHSLAEFIAEQKRAGFEFGVNHGFVVVSEEATLATAKAKMEAIPSCQDIFVTKKGTPDEPLTGWISNVRMAKFLEA